MPGSLWPDPAWARSVRARRPTYHASLLPLWDHWVVVIPDAGGVHAIVFTIAEAERTAREAIATVLDVTPESFTVIVRPSKSSPI